MPTALPLAGIRVLERADGVAASYAGRMLAALGAETIMLEPHQGGGLRRAPPFLPGGVSSAFAYFSAGKASVVCDLAEKGHLKGLAGLMAGSAILIDDRPVAQRASDGFDPREVNPDLIHVSILPFGATGPKAAWKGEEINLVHAGGEGNLLPNGLTLEQFPERPPLKIYGDFVLVQAGVAGGLGALAALFAKPRLGGQFIDISIQDVAVALGVMTIQRFGDGVLEHRLTRSFRYGGVFCCLDGYVEIITAEDHQWRALVRLLGRPAWSQDPALSDPVERGHRGAAINEQIRLWAREKCADDIVAAGQALGVPIAKYRQPAEILAGEHERSRGLFSSVPIPGEGDMPILVAPMQIDGAAPSLASGPPAIGAHQFLLEDGAA